MIKLLIGGSPCTYWSIAQSSDKREVVAEGIGWELFKNYLIAKEKFKPDYFLYENNKSAAQPIKDQISRELGVDLMYIVSQLIFAPLRAHSQKPDITRDKIRELMGGSLVHRAFCKKHHTRLGCVGKRGKQIWQLKFI